MEKKEVGRSRMAQRRRAGRQDLEQTGGGQCK